MSEVSQLLARLQARARVPLGAHVQIADRCNHRCAHCYQVQGEKGEITTGEWIGILDRLADAGVLLLNISGGEATLRPDLITILAHARSRNFAVRLFTNGLRVDDALADQLAALHLLSVEISIYSHLPEEHDHLTGVPGSWEGATGAMRRLRDRGVHCAAKWNVTSYCTSSYAEMKQLADELGATLSDSISITAMETGDTSTTERCMLPAERLTRHLAQREKRQEPLSREQMLEEHLCGACRSAVEVGPDGKYRICPALPAVIGDARTDSIEVATSNERARFVAGLKWKDIPGCSECALLPWCGRCHGDAIAQGGDMLAPYETACRVARASYSAWSGRPLTMQGAGNVGPYSMDSLCVTPSEARGPLSSPEL